MKDPQLHFIVHQLLSQVVRIAATYHAWRGEKTAGKYENLAGFCKSATTDEIIAHSYVLTPGRYVGAGEIENEDEPFEQKLENLVDTLEGYFVEASRLEDLIRQLLRGLRNA